MNISEKSLNILTKIYIFDANFFIALKNLKIPDILYNLQKVKNELRLRFLISNFVFAELNFFQGTKQKDFEKVVEIINISENMIKLIKEDLTSLGIIENQLAQDPDLSLIGLARKFIDKHNEIYIISDDFKLAENIKILNYEINYIQPSAFILFLIKNCKNSELKRYFQDIHKKILKYNLEYMLERKEIYNPLNKLIYLIENSIQISNDGIDLKESKEKSKDTSKFQKITIDDIEETDENLNKIQNLCNKYLSSQEIEDPTEIILLIPFLDEIKNSRKIIKKIIDDLKIASDENSIKILDKASDIIKKSIQVSTYILPKIQQTIFQKIAFKELSNIEFLKAILLLNKNQINDSLESLDYSAMFASLSNFKKSAIPINYLKSLILMFINSYDLAIEQFKFTEELCINYEIDDSFVYKCKIGRGIALFFADNIEESIKLFEDISAIMNKKSLEFAISVFQDMGDYFYTMAKPKIAISLYREAIECAVDSEEYKWKSKILLSKMKRAYMNAMIEETKSIPEINIDSIIDKIHTLKNFDEFNDIIADLSIFNSMLYTELEVPESMINQNVSYFDLPDFLKEKFDVVDIIQGKKNTVFIGFNEEIGLIGFRINSIFKISGFPEDYSIKLKKNSKIKILKPIEQLKAKYLIRAILEIEDPNFLEIEKSIPILFTQIQL